MSWPEQDLQPSFPAASAPTAAANKPVLTHAVNDHVLDHAGRQQQQPYGSMLVGSDAQASSMALQHVPFVQQPATLKPAEGVTDGGISSSTAALAPPVNQDAEPNRR